jgi:hypothetical protein
VANRVKETRRALIQSGQSKVKGTAGHNRVEETSSPLKQDWRRFVEANQVAWIRPKKRRVKELLLRKMLQREHSRVKGNPNGTDISDTIGLFTYIC